VCVCVCVCVYTSIYVCINDRHTLTHLEEEEEEDDLPDPNRSDSGRAPNDRSVCTSDLDLLPLMDNTTVFSRRLAAFVRVCVVIWIIQCVCRLYVSVYIYTHSYHVKSRLVLLA
jgi:hypothetical protein